MRCAGTPARDTETPLADPLPILIEEIPDPSAGPMEIAADKEDSFRIHRILHAMEEPCKEVFELRCFGELSFRQIGSIFGKTENWARVTCHRARIKLQERMEKT